jgi:threonine dehydratase
MQHTGSFKPRGAFNRILSANVPGGRHRHRVAIMARRWRMRRARGHMAESLFRSHARYKVDHLRRYGARVVTGANYAEAYALSQGVRGRPGARCACLRSGRSAGRTRPLGRELERQWALDTVAGGSWRRRVDRWCRRMVRGKGARGPQSEPGTRCIPLETGEPVDIDVSGIAADSQRTSDRQPGVSHRAAVRRSVVLVTDNPPAQRNLWDRLDIGRTRRGDCVSRSIVRKVSAKPASASA